MTADDPMGTSSFNTGGKWDDLQAPKAGDTYIANRGMRTPASGSHTFAGDALTVTGSLLWKGPDNGSLTISNLVLRGPFNNGQGNTTARIYGNISVPDDATATLGTGAETDRRQFVIYAPLSGGGALNLFIPRRSSDMKEIQLPAANTNFTGPVKIVGKGKLTISNETNLGGNPPALNPRQLTLNGSVLRLQSSLTLDDANRGLWLSNLTVTASDVYPGGRFEVGGGLTATISCLIGGDGPLEKTDLGTLVLAATNTYTGATTVTAGTLLVNSPTNATSALAVAAGAALGGTGTVHCAVTAAAGCALTLGGNGYGTLSLADPSGLSLDAASFVFDLRAPADGPSDSIALAGPLTLTGAGTVSLNLPASGLPAGSYALVTYPSHSGGGTLTLVPQYPNAALVIGDTALTLEVIGAGATRALVWKGDETANTWEFAAGHWLPKDAPFVDGTDVQFDDAGIASAPVLLAAAVAPRDITVATTNNAYTLDTGAYTLAARDVYKHGTAAWTLKGDHHYGSLIVGYDTGSGFTGGGACTLDAALTMDTGLTVRPSAGTFTQTATSTLAGNGGLTLGGAANLSGTNTFAGTATIGYANSVKNITLYSGLALGSTAGGTTLRGGTAGDYNKLILAGGVTVTNEPLTITGGSSLRAGLWSATGGTSCWDGDIRIAADGWLQIGSGPGNTFTIGSLDRTVITNSGPNALPFRDAGTIVLNSRLAMATNAIIRDDSGTLIINSTSNRIQSATVAQGTVQLGADEPFAAAPTISIGKGSDTNPGNKAALDLNGHRLTLARIIDAHGDGYNGTANEGYQRILCASPSTLTVNGSTGSSYARVGSVMSGPLTLIKAGTGALTLGQTNALSGAVIVSNGVLAVTSTGSLGLNATNVVVAGGTLSLSNSTALCTAANLTFAAAGTGVIDLPAAVNVTVSTLWYGDKQKYGGTYGASGSGAQYVDDTRFSGAGKLTVLHGNGGTFLFVE